jgi:hypothetical protein
LGDGGDGDAADLVPEISSNVGSGPRGRLLVSKAVVDRNRLSARLSSLSECRVIRSKLSRESAYGNLARKNLSVP